MTLNFSVEYNENNNGGRVWLGKELAEKLIADGWKNITTTDHAMFGLWTLQKVFVAKNAKEAMTIAIREWEKVTKMDASEEGCNCCGPPHSFSCKKETTDKTGWEYYESACGDGCLEYLYPNTPVATKRELIERLDGEKVSR